MSEEAKKQGPSAQKSTRRLGEVAPKGEGAGPGLEEKGAIGDVTSMPFFQTRSLVGTQIDAWRLEAMLGEGGMSAVYLAKHMWLQQKAAVKVLLPEYCRDVDVLHRFQQEALAVSRLEHPNIIEVRDFGVDPNNGFFMVLEYLQGQDMETVMSEAPFPKTWLLHVFEQILQGLHVTHSADIIHRDLKPSNIFLLPGKPLPKVKILDFGVAKVQFQDTEQAASKLTKTGIVVGTPAYLAPEQISPQGKTLPSSDVYALGVILYQCLTGELPLEADTPVGFLLKVLQEEPLPISAHRPELKDSALEALVGSMLSKKPEARPQSATEVWQQLKAAFVGFEDSQDKVEFYPQVKISEPQQRERAGIEAFTFDETRGNVLPTASDGLLTTGPLSHGSLPAEKAPPTGGNRYVVPLLIGFLFLGIAGFFGVRWASMSGTKPPTRLAARAPAPKRSPLDDLMIKGRRALDQKRYLAATRIWKQALVLKGVRKSGYLPKIYKAIGYAYGEQKWLHTSLYYFNKYKKLVQQRQEKAAALRKQMAAAKDNPAKQQELDLALRKLLLGLPKEEEFKKDFSKLSELREDLRARRRAGSRVLATLRKKWSDKDWGESQTLLQRLKDVAPSIPELHLEAARMLASTFLARALAMLRNIKDDMAPTGPQRIAIDALTKQLSARQRVLGKEWREVLAQAATLLKANQVRKAMGLLRKLLQPPQRLAEGRLHKIWRSWLKQKTQAMPRKMRPVWRLYAKKMRTLKQKGLWGWLQAHDKKALSAKEIRDMLQWLNRIDLARRQFLQAERSLAKAQLPQAQNMLEAFLRKSLIPKKKDPWELARQVNAMRTQAKAMLAKLGAAVPAYRKLLQAQRQALFDDAAKHRAVVQEALKGTKAATVLATLATKQLRKQARAEKHLAAGQAAFVRYRWKPARAQFLAYKKLFPSARNMSSIKKRLKTCRCALHIFPWETCDKLKIPGRRTKPTPPKRR